MIVYLITFHRTNKSEKTKLTIAHIYVTANFRYLFETWALIRGGIFLKHYGSVILERKKVTKVFCDRCVNIFSKMF